jgi:hypothetical protein
MIMERFIIMGIPLNKIREIEEKSENNFNLEKELKNLLPEILSIYPEDEYFQNSEIKDKTKEIINSE